MSKAVLFQNHVVVDNLKFFRTNASSLSIGIFGNKRRTVPPYLETLAFIPFESPKYMLESTEFSIDIDQKKKANLAMNFNQSQVLGLDLNHAFQHIQEGKLKFLRFSVIDRLEAVKGINADATVLRAWKSMVTTQQPRICLDILQVVDANIASKFQDKTNVVGHFVKSGTGIQLSVSLQNDVNTNQTFQVGSTFAYLLQKATAWSSPRRESIRLIGDDQYGPS